MMPEALLVHDAHGRARLRVPELKRRSERLERITSRLREHPGVDRVESSPVTASVVLYHRVPVEEILAFAKSEGLFEVRDTCPTSLIDCIKGVDQRLRRFSLGRTDLAQVGALALLVGAVVQIFRGRYLPPATSLLNQAITLLAETRPHH
jgi:hypothetical protein